MATYIFRIDDLVVAKLSNRDNIAQNLYRGGGYMSEAEGLFRRASGVGTASLHEAAKRRGALPWSLKPLSPQMAVAGPAFTVRSPLGDNLWLHRALEQAAAGDILVVDAGNGSGFGYWGEVMARAALARGIAGLVLSGGVRDSARLIELGLPTFCLSVAIQGTGKNFAGDGALGEPVRFGDVLVRQNDLIVGDADGLFTIPIAEAPAVIAEAERREIEESAIFARLAAGELTLDIYGLRNGEPKS
ncbi:RraA family protein [Sphingopyxis sp. Q841]|uniref:RraA family protein n=1 Tax=Sphingopyxis sp. Q841 TaxID=3458250 RepID=UPI004036E055